MADINHVISLGIGSPAAIKQFLTFGLGVGIAAGVAVPLSEVLAVQCVLSGAEAVEYVFGHAELLQVSLSGCEAMQIGNPP